MQRLGGKEDGKEEFLITGLFYWAMLRKEKVAWAGNVMLDLEIDVVYASCSGSLGRRAR